MKQVFKYKEYKYHEVSMGHLGIKKQYIFKFDNDYGASVITGGGCWGNAEIGKPYEVAGILFNDNSYDLINEEPQGYLTTEEVNNLLDEIKAI